MKQSAEFVVIVGDKADTELYDAIQLLGTFSDSSLHDFAFINADDLAGKWEDVNAVLKSSTDNSANNTTVSLFGWLAASRSNLKKIRIAVASTRMLDQDSHLRLSSGLKKLEQAVGLYATQAESLLYGVAFPSVNDGPPTAQLMRPGVRANLIVIPRDSSSFEAVAKPISRQERVAFIAHIATEIATLFSLWREMSDKPAIDELPLIPTGDSETIVYFASSRVGILNCPPLPIAQLISGEGELPCPHEYFPLPDADQRSDHIASILYPNHLVYRPTALGDLAVSVSVKGFWGRYVRELMAVIGGMPRLVRGGVQAEIDAIAGTALQEALGGSESIVRIVGVDTPGEVAPISADYVESVIDAVSALKTEPLLSAMGSETWSNIVELFLGIVDGGKSAEEVRRQIADERYLTVLQEALGPSVIDLDGAFEDIYYGTVVDVSEPESESGNQGGGDATLPLAPVIGVNTLPAPFVEVNTATEDAVDAQPREATPNSSEMEAVLSESGASRALPAVERKHSTVLARIGGLLEDNANTASNRVAQMIDVLRGMPGKFQARQAAGYSTAAKMAIALGFSVIYLVTGSLTERRYFLSGEPLTSNTRDLIWTLASTSLILVALLGLTFKNSNNSQGRAIAFGTLSLVLLAAEYVFFAPVREFILSLSIVRRSAIVGVVILALTMAVVGVSYSRNRLSSLNLRKRYASLLLVTAWIYVVIGLTAYMGSDWSPLRNLSSGGTLRLIVVGYVLGGALILTAALVTAFVIMRERYRLDRARAELAWAIEELTVAADATRRLTLARSQWLGTAVPLARLIRYPLGASIVHSADSMVPERPVLGVLKVREEILRLKKPGEQSLSARLRALFIRTGWIARQYHQLMSRYREDRALTLGLRTDALLNDRPERCPATPTYDDVISGKARGARWDFMRSVVGGDYDDSLLSIAGEVPLEEAYETIIDDPEAHSIGETELIAPTFFARLLPGTQLPLPGGLVKTLFAANDDRRYLTASIWWPDELVARPQLTPAMNLHRADVLTPDRLNSWIRLFGACVLTSKPFRLSDVTLSGILESFDEESLQVDADSQIKTFDY
jgi:hypothetical protein